MRFSFYVKNLIRKSGLDSKPHYGGDIPGKPCAFRSGRISLCGNLSSPNKKFPITPQNAELPRASPDRHLEHTIIPGISRLEQSRSFPWQTLRILILFCKAYFIALGEFLCLTQGRLLCTQRRLAHRVAGFPPVSSFRNRYGSPRKLGRKMYAVTSRPKSFTPSSSPRLGNESHHQKLHRCALWRYFNPAFGVASLTRILHHQ